MITKIGKQIVGYVYSNLILLTVIGRIFIICLQIISNALIPDHDAGVFTVPNDNQTTGKYDWLIELMFGGFRRWDAQYFLFIAEHGYVYENSLAFQPLYPFSIRSVAALLKMFIPDSMISSRQLVVVVAVLINVFFFVMAMHTLHKLTKTVFNNKAKANVAVLLFIINPASVFFSAPYTESLYAWLSFKVMLMSISNVDSFFICVPLGLSILCRSNGLVNFGFLFYFAIKKICQRFSMFESFRIILRTAIITSVAMAQYILLQWYIYQLFCRENDFKHPVHIVAYGVENNLVLSGTHSDHHHIASSWCNDSLPLSYGYVQKTYWNVGFMNYYEFKQIPNFLLAFPIILIFLNCCFKYLLHNQSITLKLGLFGERKRRRTSNHTLFPFIVHGLFLTSFCIGFVHIQITTRMLASSSPLLYWFCADYLMNDTNKDPEVKDILLTKYTKIILYYFFGYSVIGTVMFCNFLPWT